MADGLNGRKPLLAPTGATWRVIAGEWGACANSYAVHGAGQHSLAVIDCGLVDFEMAWRQFTTVGKHYGVAWRKAADGTGGHTVFFGVSTPGVHPAGATIYVKTYMSDPSFVSGTEHTFLLRVRGIHARLYVDGVLWYDMNQCAPAVEGNTYVGFYTYHEGEAIKWDSLAVVPFPGSQEYKITVLGDSEMEAKPDSVYNTFPYLVATRDTSGRFSHVAANHALGGQQIEYWLATEVPAAANDDADLILSLIGCLDRYDPDIAGDYEAGLLALSASNPRAEIFCLGVLNTTRPDIAAQRATLNANIQTAVSNAATAGVNVTYVDTDDWIDPGPPEWTAETVYGSSDEIRPPTWGLAIVFKTAAGGTSGESAPAWPTTVGQTVEDGTVTWEAIASTYDTWDGLHPNESGNDKIATALIPLLP